MRNLCQQMTSTVRPKSGLFALWVRNYRFESDQGWKSLLGNEETFMVASI